MTMLEPEELKARLEGLADGPWTHEGTLARKKLRLPDISFTTLARNSQIDLTNLTLSARALALQRSLEKPLRPHWVKAIEDKQEMKFRASLDSALTYLQLIELAVETGYLQLEQLPADVKENLIELMWASPVRNFIQTYDYTTVEFLAQRLGVISTSRQTVPEADPKGSVKFAAFLATHRQVERDNLIGAWLSFLDDFIQQEDEQNKFYEFLIGDDSKKSKRFTTLVAGARSFVVLLADFFVLTDNVSKGRFALFYSYWFAKMYGFELGKRGYVKNREIWGSKDSWAMALLRYFVHRGEADGEGSVAADDAKRIAHAIFLLMRAWEAALRYGLLSQSKVMGQEGVVNAALDMHWIEENMKDPGLR